MAQCHGSYLQEMRVACLCKKYNITLYPFKYAETYVDL